jgi:hypothetical protein
MQSLLRERYKGLYDKASPCTAPNDAAPKMFLLKAKVSFREADVRRAIRGAQRAGLEVGSVRIEPDGCIVIIPKGEIPLPGPANDLDHWMAVNARSPQGH